MRLLALLTTLAAATSAAVAGGRLAPDNTNPHHFRREEGAGNHARDAKMPIANRHHGKNSNKIARDARLPLIANRHGVKPVAAKEVHSAARDARRPKVANRHGIKPVAGKQTHNMARDARIPLVANRHGIKPVAAKKAHSMARDARLPLVANRHGIKPIAATTSIVKKIARDAVEALSASAPFKADSYADEWIAFMEEQHESTASHTATGKWPTVTEHVARAVAGAYDQLNSFADGIKQRAAEAEARARAHAAQSHTLHYKRDLESGEMDFTDEGAYDEASLHARDTDDGTDGFGISEDDEAIGDNDYDDDDDDDEYMYDDDEDVLDRRAAEPTEIRPHEPAPQPTVYTTVEPKSAPKTTPAQHHGHGGRHIHAHYEHIPHPGASASHTTQTASV